MHRPHVDDAFASALLVHAPNAARVVRNAPSELNAQQLFPTRELEFLPEERQSGYRHCSPAHQIGRTVPWCAPTPASTCCSLVTSMATPRPSATAELRRGRVGSRLVQIGNHDARAFAHVGLAISLPIPLAARRGWQLCFCPSDACHATPAVARAKRRFVLGRGGMQVIIGDFPRPRVRSQRCTAETISSTGNSATSTSTWSCAGDSPGPVHAPLSATYSKRIPDQLRKFSRCRRRRE